MFAIAILILTIAILAIGLHQRELCTSGELGMLGELCMLGELGMLVQCRILVAESLNITIILAILMWEIGGKMGERGGGMGEIGGKIVLTTNFRE